MIKINLVAETPAAATVQAERPQFSLGAKQGDIILLIVLALALIVIGTQWFLSDEQTIGSERRSKTRGVASVTSSWSISKRSKNSKRDARCCATRSTSSTS